MECTIQFQATTHSTRAISSFRQDLIQNTFELRPIHTANFQNSDFGRPFEYATLMAYSQENRQENILTFLRMRECYLWEVERRPVNEPVKNVGSDFMKAKSGLFLNKIKLDDIIIIWNSITLQLQQKLLTRRF